jgi:type VI secretion system VasI family protein
MFEIAFLSLPLFGTPALDWQTARRSEREVLIYKAASGKDPRPILSIECRHGVTSLTVYWRQSLGSAVAQRITYAIDHDRPRGQYWRLTADLQAVAMWGASSISFSKQLIGKSQLVVYARSRSGEILQARFTLAGLERALAPVEHECRWRGTSRQVQRTASPAILQSKSDDS